MRDTSLLECQASVLDRMSVKHEMTIVLSVYFFGPFTWKWLEFQKNFIELFSFHFEAAFWRESIEWVSLVLLIGAYGEVRKCLSKETNALRAVKIINKKYL